MMPTRTVSEPAAYARPAIPIAATDTAEALMNHDEKRCFRP
jgi:hypothetical protein